MHLVENFALAAGVKIGEPQIEPLYFPTGSEKYVTLHASSGMESKNYDYYKDVVATISPKLKERGIDIIQIGEKSEKHIPETVNLLGETSLRQAFYILMNSTLHIGNDSFSCHIAARYGVPLVALYGPTYPSTCKPYWGDSEKQSILSPDFSEKKPSFSAKEREKRVNEIFPDVIARHALDYLGISNDLERVHPVHLGKHYHLSIVDVVPNFSPPAAPIFNTSSIINLRLDYMEDLLKTPEWLEKFNCAVHIDRMVDLKQIKKHKKSIKRINAILNEDFTEDYLEELGAIGAKCLLSYRDEETISDIRVKFFSSNIHHEEPGSKKDLDNWSKICDTTHYKSSLTLLSNNKIYPSKAALDLNLEKQEEQFIIDKPEFYKESGFFKIYNYAT